MQTTNHRNLYNISSKKLGLFILAIFFTNVVCAQFNIEKHDAKRENNGYSYGIHLGFSQHNFTVEHSDSFLQQDQILGIEGNNQGSASIGIIGALHPSDNIEIRTIPSISFGNQGILYYVDGFEQAALYEGAATVFELPIQFKYKSEPYKDFRMFGLAGGMFRNNFSAEKNIEQDLQTIILEQQDYAFEIGAGVEFHFPYFVLAPELTITQGFNNQLKSQNTAFSNAISSLNSRIYSLAINIE